MRGANDGTHGNRELGKPLTGRAVLIWLLAFFGVVIGVNALMAKLAIDTMPGTEVESSYQAGNVYNAEISAAREQDARRWRVQAHIERVDRGAIIKVEAQDRDGHPIAGLVFTAQLERPIDQRADRRLTLTQHGGGVYSSEAPALAPGQWDLVLEADQGSQRVFLSRSRFVLE